MNALASEMSSIYSRFHKYYMKSWNFDLHSILLDESFLCTYQ